MNKANAIRLDNIITKFNNQTLNRNKFTNSELNDIDLLLSENVLYPVNNDNWHLTPKGMAMLSDMKNEGYFVQYKTTKKQQSKTFERICWVISIALAVIGTWFIAKGYYKQDNGSTEAYNTIPQVNYLTTSPKKDTTINTLKIDSNKIKKDTNNNNQP
jgi:hypothetical protein